jgi:hypothetical protein
MEHVNQSEPGNNCNAVSGGSVYHIYAVFRVQVTF